MRKKHFFYCLRQFLAKTLSLKRQHQLIFFISYFKIKVNWIMIIIGNEGGYLQYVLFLVTSKGWIQQSFDALVEGIVKVK